MYLGFLREERADIKGLVCFSLTLNLSWFNSIDFSGRRLVSAALIQGKLSRGWCYTPCVTGNWVWVTLRCRNGEVLMQL